MQLRLKPDQKIDFKSEIANKIYIHLVDCELEIEGEKIFASDGIAISNKQNVVIESLGLKQAYALIFDLP